MFIYSYNPNSESAIALARALDARMIRHTNSQFKGHHDKLVVNWGSTDLPREVRKCCVINKEHSVMMAVNKLTALQRMHDSGVSTVQFTTYAQQALGWLNEDGKVIARQRLTGADGAGLIVVRRGEPIPEAKLYTRFLRAQKEYRINVCNGEVIGRQRKVPLEGVPQDRLTPDVKTTNGGYGFKWVTRNIPGDVENQAIRAVAALDLDFAGVDVIWDGERARVLEVNTAPQLTPIMVQKLSGALEDWDW